ncbi:MAG: GSCFA domain-containing protein [Muribaculaceae bacterium]|nr:GSCFA domain-containing protein [Muribaculaceae bacterium]
MKFRTELELKGKSISLTPDLPVVMLGSCFAENIVGRMRRSLWNAANPLGTLYNPLSIDIALRVFLREDESSFRKSIFHAGGLYRTWLADSSMAAETIDDVMREFKHRQKTLRNMLDKGRTLFITFGTSWCYYLSEEKDYVVANCHKQPARIFTRKRVSIAEIVEVWARLVNDLTESYPRLNIVFTVSPVRHLKDGFEGNSVSKAVLRLAVDELCNRFSNCHYFPAYEIMNDDLRDYRFYASDLVHPSEEAVDYIWEKFRENYLDEKGMAILKEGEKIWKAFNHRPLPNATLSPSEASLEAEKRRLTEIREKLEVFRKAHPAMLDI